MSARKQSPGPWPAWMIAIIVAAILALALRTGATAEITRLARGVPAMMNICSAALPGAPKYRDPASPHCHCPPPDSPAWIPPQALPDGRIDLGRTDQWACGASLTVTGG